MMVLSRLWYVVCAIAAALAFYAVSLAVGQFNRTLEGAMKEELKADVQVVGWALQLDARRRLDAFLMVSADDVVRKSLKAAAAVKEGAPNAREAFINARGEGKKALAAVVPRLPEDVRPDIAFSVDREGRVAGFYNFPAAENAQDFELGGYPAVFDALRGFLRDDTWLIAGKVYRVTARPVEDDLTQPPLGAVVGLKEINAHYAEELAKLTRASVVFFNGELKLGQASSDDDLTSAVFDAAATQGGALEKDAYGESGRSEFQQLTANKNEAAGAMFVRLPGEAGSLGATYGVVRRQPTHGGPMDFITTASESDKARVQRWVIVVAALGLALIGILLTFLEHARPLAAFRKQAAKLQKGEQDSFQLPLLAADYRRIGGDINAAIERIVEGRGGMIAKKPADLQAILGPSQQGMSAFSLPNSGPASAPASASAPAPAAAPPQAKGGFVPPPPKKPAGGLGGPPSVPKPGAPAISAPPAAAPKLAPPAPKLVPPSAMHLDDEVEDEEATRVGSAPGAVLAAAAGEAEDPEWRAVYEDFVNTKRQCGEATDALTFEKFQNTLRKNRDQLMQRHGTKRVKFSVYVKEGKAALKATPLKE